MQTAITHIDYKTLYEQQVEKIAELNYEIAALKHQLEQLKKMIFGSKHERFVRSDDSKANAQLALALEAETIAQCKITDATKVAYIRTKTEVTQNKPKAHPGRMKLPEHLRREVRERLTRIVTKTEKYYISGFFQFCGNSSAMFDVV